ncbi:MAG: protein kinase [bacterium]
MVIGIATSETAVDYHVGDRIGGRYLIEDIRRGNMGIVYLGSDLATSQPIALKTFETRYLDSQRNRVAFMKEASTWIQLERHPNIVQAYSIQQFDSQPYLLLERIPTRNLRGCTLKDLIFSEPLSVQRMIQIGIHICDGMIHALGKFPGLVHRDLKSENILAGPDGLPKISDFGMTLQKEIEFPSSGSAKPGNGFLDLTDLARRLVGTPAFASPEQCLSLHLDTRSDIYSCGCILYHMAVKRMPFHRDTVEKTILAQVNEAPVPPHLMNEQIPRDYSALILTCLAKKPEARFDSFSSLRRELIYLHEVLFGEEPASFRAGLPLTVDEYVARAQSFALIQQYAQAQAELRKALQAFPRRLDVYYHLSRISFLQKRYERALAECEKALTALPNDPDLHLLRGRISHALSLAAKAELAFQKAIQLAPDRAEAYREWAGLCLERRDYLAAERTLRDALVYCEEKGPFYLQLADLYLRTGKINERYQALERAAQWLPWDVDCLLSLAELSERFHRPARAMAWAFKALQASPHTFPDWYRLGRLFQRLKDTRLAAEAWTHAAALGEGDADFYLELTSLYLNLREFDDAWTYALQAELRGADVQNLKATIQSKRIQPRA